MKIAPTEKSAKKLYTNFNDGIRLQLQWKGTESCADFVCKCGAYSHIDGYFMHNIQCPKCGTMYNCNPNIELIEIVKKPETCLLIPQLSED